MNSGRREECAGLSRVHHRPHSVKTNKSDPRVTSPLATKPESRAPPPPRLLRAALSSIPPYPSPALASLFSGRAYSAVDRGSAVTWVGGEERRTERERERESVPPPPPPQFAVCYVSYSEVESQSCSSGGSQPLNPTPVSSLILPLSPSRSPGLLSLRSRGSFYVFFLSTSANSLLFLDLGFSSWTF